MAVVDIWRWKLDSPDIQVLNTEEVARSDRFVFDRDRVRYVAGRGRLRHILGRYLGQKPEQVEFRYGPFGKPEIDGLSFNMSHTSDYAVLGVVQSDIPMGIDVELIRPIEMAVAETHFAPTEFAALEALPDSEKCDAFHRIWTRKEAYLKAWGTGLSTDLNSFTVSIARDDPCLLGCESGEADEWKILNVEAPLGIAGALAIRTGDRDVRLVEKEWC